MVLSHQIFSLCICFLSLIGLNLSVTEAIQCAGYKETEGDTVLQRDKAYTGPALPRTAHQEQLPDFEG